MIDFGAPSRTTASSSLIGTSPRACPLSADRASHSRERRRETRFHGTDKALVGVAAAALAVGWTVSALDLPIERSPPASSTGV
jgi:hypothetical protein